MICGPCKRAGTMARYGVRARQSHLRLIGIALSRTARLSHQDCPGKGFCDCQHLPPAVPQPVRDVSE